MSYKLSDEQILCTKVNLAGGSSCCVRRPGSGVSPANSQVALAEPVPWRGVSECSDVIYVEGTFYLYRYTLVKSFKSYLVTEIKGSFN